MLAPYVQAMTKYCAAYNDLMMVPNVDDANIEYIEDVVELIAADGTKNRFRDMLYLFPRQNAKDYA